MATSPPVIFGGSTLSRTHRELSLKQALDNNYLTFTTGGNASWSGQTAVSFYGGSSAQSGVLGGSQSAWLQTTVVGPGALSFSWKVSSERDG